MFADLVQGEIFRWRNVDIERTFTNIADYADNLPHGRPSALIIGDALADGYPRRKTANKRIGTKAHGVCSLLDNLFQFRTGPR